MDVEEMKKYSKNKIEADDLIKQVRQQIKETTWEKQNLREGFTETFRPLISQFEDPGKDSKTQNIFTQNQKMLQNQLALTEGIKGNQLAIKDLKDKQDIFNRGFEKYERLADMEELPGVEAIEYGEDDEKDSEDDKDDQAQAPLPKDDQAQAPLPKEDKTPIAKFNVSDLDVNLSKKKLDLLFENDYENPPSYYFDKNIEEVNTLINKANTDLQKLAQSMTNTADIVYAKGYQLAKARNQKPHKKTKENIDFFNALSIYTKNLNDLLIFKEKSGSGLFSNPEELLHRFELLNGSLVAGNNGVLPEFIQIAHRLRDLGIITNNQLNTLLRKVI